LCSGIVGTEDSGYEDWQTAAQFCADHKINLEEALVWADKAISGPFRGATVRHEDFSTLQTKASVLEAMGRVSEAESVVDKAFHLPGTDAVWIYAYGMTPLRANQNSKAMDVFVYNRQQHPEEKYRTFLGLARGYTAVGDKKNAIANWQTVLPLPR
jgi:tetratricopeptide (TPR) repeat protein